MDNRRRTRVAAASVPLAVILLGSAMLGAPGASAAKAPPGDDGTVKIREVVDGEPSTEKAENANDPKVCDFLIEARGFEGVPELDWSITEGPPFKGEPVVEGTIELTDGDGDSRVIDELDEGQYKLDVTFDGQKSSDAKHKVFKIDCPDEEEVEATGGGGGGDPEATGEEPMGDEPAAEEVKATGEEAPADPSAVAGEYAPRLTADDAGPAAAGAVDAGGGGMSGPTALPALLVGGGLLTLGAVAARRARARG